MQTDHGTRTSSVPVNLQNQRKKQLFLTNPYLSVPVRTSVRTWARARERMVFTYES